MTMRRSVTKVPIRDIERAYRGRLPFENYVYRTKPMLRQAVEAAALKIAVPPWVRSEAVNSRGQDDTQNKIPRL